MILTLLSDFGLQDNFVGISKGILVEKNPSALMVDITHEVTPFHLLQCSYLLNSAYNYFPANTIHISLFDILHTVPAAILVTQMNNQIIISADNGLLPHTFSDELKEVYKYGREASTYIEWVHNLASLVKEIQEHHFDINWLTPAEAASIVLRNRLKPVVKEDNIECQVIHIDRFGNVVLNIQKKQFEELRAGRDFKITIPPNEVLTEIKHYYKDVPQGEKLCLFNSGGYLEIAINKGAAAPLFGLFLSKERDVVYKNIKIEFITKQKQPAISG